MPGNSAFVAAVLGALFASVFLSRSLLVATSSITLVLGAWAIASRHRMAALRLPLAVPLLVLLAVLVLSSLVSLVVFGPYPLGHPLGKLRYFLLFFPVGLAFVERPALWTVVRRLSLVLAPALALVGCLQFFGLWSPRGVHDLPSIPGSGERLHHAVGFLVHHVPYSYGAILLFHVLLGAALTEPRPRARAAYLTGAVLAAVALAVSFSRGSWIAWLVSVAAVFLVAAPRRALAFLALVALVVGAAALVSPPLRDRLADIRPGSERNSERVALWSLSTRMFLDAPVLGQGYHSFGTRREKYITDEKQRFNDFKTDPHSLYFDLLGGSGLIGLAAFLWLALAALRDHLTALRRRAPEGEDRAMLLASFGALVAMLVANVTDTHLYLTNSLAGSLFLLAMGEATVFRLGARAASASPHPSPAPAPTSARWATLLRRVP